MILNLEKRVFGLNACHIKDAKVEVVEGDLLFNFEYVGNDGKTYSARMKAEGSTFLNIYNVNNGLYGDCKSFNPSTESMTLHGPHEKDVRLAPKLLDIDNPPINTPGVFVVYEEKATELTLKEIEKRLGCKIKIVEDK